MLAFLGEGEDTAKIWKLNKHLLDDTLRTKFNNFRQRSRFAKSQDRHRDGKYRVEVRSLRKLSFITRTYQALWEDCFLAMDDKTESLPL